MAFDFYSDTAKSLYEQHRTKALVDFCEQIIRECPDRSQQCIGYRDLSEAQFFLMGDGVRAREANIEALKILDSDFQNLVRHPKRIVSWIMERVYSDLCEQVCALSLSYEEYIFYAEKAERAGLRPKNPTEIRGIAACKRNQANGEPWCNDRFQVISDYVSHNAHGQAASVLSTVIANRRSMCVTGQDLNIFVLTTYANAVAGLVAEHIDYCTSSKGHAANWNDYEGILTTALALIHSCENDADIQPEVVANALDTLNSAQYDLRKQALLSSTFGKDPKPTQLQIDAGLETYLQDLPPVVAAASSSASASGKPEPLGCAIALFLLAGVILMDLNTQNGATRVMMIIFCAVLVIAGIVMWLSRRKE